MRILVSTLAAAGVVLVAACSPAAAPAPSTSSVPFAAPSASPSGAPSPAPSPVAAAPSPSTAPNEQALTHIRMSQTGIAPQYWPLYVAQAKGYLTAEGLVVDNTVLNSSVTQTEALMTGDIDINGYTPDAVALAASKGVAMKYVAVAEEAPNFQFIVGPDINTWSDLKGKNVASGAPLGYYDVVMKAMLGANGLQPSDYNVISIGSEPQRLPALQAGQISGFITTEPDASIAMEAGYRSMGFVGDYVTDIEYGGYAIMDSWGSAHTGTMEAFLRAMQRGTDFLYDPANKAEAISIYGQVVDLQPEYRDAIYDQLITKQMLSRTMQPNPTGITNLLTLSVQYGEMPSIPPLETWIDTSYLDAAEQSLGH